MENLVRKHYIISCIIFVSLWIIEKHYIWQKYPYEISGLLYLIDKIIDSLLIAIFVVTIEFFFLDIKKRYYLGISSEDTLYYNIDIQQLQERVECPNGTIGQVSHGRITSGDDIIAYSYVEDFLNYLRAYP